MENTNSQIQWINIFAILLSPLIAVLVSKYMMDRKEKRERKDQLFKTLMAYRKTIQLNPEWVKAQNLIDVIFCKNKEVLKIWHELYDIIHGEWSESIQEKRNHKYIELLSAMAKDLGYKTLSQIDMDKFYEPVGYGNQLMYNMELQNELLRVLKNTAQIEVKKKDTNSKNGE